MLGFIIKFFAPSSYYLEVPLAGLLLTVGILTSEAKLVLNDELHTPATPQVVWNKVVGKETISAPRGKLPEKDGTYLYSQSPKPEQVGQEYIVFEVRGSKVIGALYLPHSEFSCFSGTLQSGSLALMVANGPDSAPSEDSIAAQNSQQVATASEQPQIEGYSQTAYPYSVALQDYHQLASVSGNDQQILRTCKQ